MKVLVACEESQAVTIELRRLGHEAYSCDIIPCSGGHPEWHLQQDVLPLLEQKWDMIIAFPPCTYLTTTGNRHFSLRMNPPEKVAARIKKRSAAEKFFLMFANTNCEKIAIENPVGYMNTHYRKPNQIIQPYYFGDPFEKRTCLWLKGLPKLEQTNVVDTPQRQILRSGKSMPSWYSKGGKDRQKNRSKTFPGIARAIAEQWGGKI